MREYQGLRPKRDPTKGKNLENTVNLMDDKILIFETWSRYQTIAIADRLKGVVVRVLRRQRETYPRPFRTWWRKKAKAKPNRGIADAEEFTWLVSEKFSRAAAKASLVLSPRHIQVLSANLYPENTILYKQRWVHSVCPKEPTLDVNKITAIARWNAMEVTAYHIVFCTMYQHKLNCGMFW